MNTTEKFWWVHFHPAYNKELGCKIELTPRIVNPVNNVIEEDKTLNTKQQWWVEVSFEENDGGGDTAYNYYMVHDWDVDTGGDTIDECIDNLYKLVKEKYGDYND